MTDLPELPLTANPSLVWLPLFAALALLVGLIALLPAVLLVLSLLGLLGMSPSIEIALLAMPTAAVAVFFLVVASVIVADLRLPRPVLAIDERGVFDRRITDTPIAWSDVVEAAPAPGGGGVLLALRFPLETRLSPYRAGTAGFRHPAAGIANIPVRGMDRPAKLLADTLLALAMRNGAVAPQDEASEAQ
ncbi:MAG: hypothetical protein JWQ89_3368 [Devosia sp.]|uniref:hypothetical protein n=1 Tax=Devosia sp. TaxID=1871048 RepID=UPI0026371AF2|nr:hypothetical protein [Devosia sp.]MDB5541641.1 hypothetical protein [Devosia sp.]